MDLGEHYSSRPVLRKDIASRQGISERYLEQLINALRIAGLIKSARGPHGGYILARKPSEINLCEVVRALEGSVVLVDCLDKPDICRRSCRCAARDVWRKMADAMESVLESITLQVLVDMQMGKDKSSAFIYNI